MRRSRRSWGKKRPVSRFQFPVKGSPAGVDKRYVIASLRAGPPLRIAGIDPGTRRVGYCILERQGMRVRAIAMGVIAPRGRDMKDRLLEISNELDRIFAEHKPVSVTVERAFVGKNKASALAIGLARGVIMVCAARCGAQVGEVAPSVAKVAVAAGGAAPKARVQRMVQLLLGLSAPPPPDAADAVALALAGA